MNTSTATTTAPGFRIAGDLVAPRRERRAVSYCDIWDLVAADEPCPACEDSFQDRLKKATGPR